MIDQDTPPFYYRALRAPRAFRLLHVKPGKSGQDLHCELTGSHLDESVPFEALSYTWGNPKARVDILLNRKRLAIGESLYLALQALRYHDRPRTLWVDALCINQSNPAEKSVQVPLMRDIYRGAKLVVAWVGQEDDMDSRALEIGKYLTKSGKVEGSISGATELSTWLALPVFIQRPWFSRIWIVQELALAKDLAIHCGSRQLKWSVLRDGMDMFRQKMGMFLSVSNTDISLERIFILLKVRNLVTEHKPDQEYLTQQLGHYHIDQVFPERAMGYMQPGDILSLVQATRTFGATDPRDRIFAMLGMALPCDVEEIEVRYDEGYTYGNLYRDFAQMTISQYGTLDVLSHAGLHANNPSWVANWSQPRNSCPLKLSAYDASRASNAQFEFSSAGNTLHVRGHIVDTIDHVVPGFYISGHSQQLFERPITRIARFALPVSDLRHFRDPRKSLKMITDQEATGVNTIERISPNLETSWRSVFDTLPSLLPESEYARILTGDLPFGELQDAQGDLTHDSFLTWRSRLDMNPVISRRVEQGVQWLGKYGKLKVEVSPELLAVYYMHHDPATVREKKQRREKESNITSGIRKLLSGEDKKDDGHRDFNEALAEAQIRKNIVADAGNAAVFVSQMFSRNVERMARNRCLCKTAVGRAGWSPAETQVGDVVAVLNGAKVPLVLRQVLGRVGVFQVVGESYIHGIMQGQVFALEGSQEITLV